MELDKFWNCLGLCQYPGYNCVLYSCGSIRYLAAANVTAYVCSSVEDWMYSYFTSEWKQNNINLEKWNFTACCILYGQVRGTWLCTERKWIKHRHTAHVKTSCNQKGCVHCRRVASTMQKTKTSPCLLHRTVWELVINLGRQSVSVSGHRYLGGDGRRKLQLIAFVPSGHSFVNIHIHTRGSHCF